MAKKSLRVVIPMAGLGTRLRPHTWSKPKQLVSLAGKSVLDHLLNSISTIPDTFEIEIICIVGYLGDMIEEYMRAHYPHVNTRFVVQEDPRGQSHAIKLAEEYLSGQMIVVFADTLIEADLSTLGSENIDGIAWVKPTPDPRRFGVAEPDEMGFVKRLVEKPTDIKNNLVVVGFYYFKEAEALLSAIDKQMDLGIQLKGEFYLVDAINLMLDRGMKMRIEKIDTWLDAGTREALLETNQYYLDHGRDNSNQAIKSQDTLIIPPVYIHPDAKVEHSIIGPYTSISTGCKIRSSIIKNSILEEDVLAEGISLVDSLIGRRAHLTHQATSLNIGDDSVMEI